MGKNSRKSERNVREKAAEMRKEAEAAQARRERLVKIIAGASVVAVTVGIVGIAAFASSQNPNTSSNPAAAVEVPDAPLPKGVIPSGEDFAYGFPVGTPSSSDVPTLQVWEDFQCPACGDVERLNGRGIKNLGTTGRAKIILQPTTFLDANTGTNHSLNVTAAWGCAIDQDKGIEYHATIFANQPKTAGEGWTQEKLIEMGTEAGIPNSQLPAFTACIKDGTYLQWAKNSTAVFYASNIDGTPTGVINGTEIVRGQILGDPVELEKALFGTRN